MKLTRNKISKIFKTKNQSYKKFNKQKKCNPYTVRQKKIQNQYNKTPKKRYLKNLNTIIGGGRDGPSLGAAMGSKYQELQTPPLVSSPSISDVSTTGTQGRDPLVAAPPTLPSQNLAETAIDEVQQQKDIIAESDKLGELKYKANMDKFKEDQDKFNATLLESLGKSKQLSYDLIKNLISKIPHGPIQSSEPIDSENLNVKDDRINLSDDFEKNQSLIVEGPPRSLINTLSFYEFEKKTKLSWTSTAMQELKSTKTFKDKRIAAMRSGKDKLKSFFGKQKGGGVDLNCLNLSTPECNSELTRNNILNLTDFQSATSGFIDKTGTYQLELTFSDSSQVTKYLKDKISEFRSSTGDSAPLLDEKYLTNYKLYSNLGVALLSKYKTTDDNILQSFQKIETQDLNNNFYLINITYIGKKYLFGNFIEKKLFSGIIISVPTIITNKVIKNILIKIKLPQSFYTLLRTLILPASKEKEDVIAKAPACPVSSSTLKAYYSEKMKQINTRDLFISKTIPPGYVAIAKAYNMGNAFDPALQVALGSSNEESASQIVLAAINAVTNSSLNITSWNALAKHLNMDETTLLRDLLPKLQKISSMPNLTIKEMKRSPPPINSGGGSYKENKIINMFGAAPIPPLMKGGALTSYQQGINNYSILKIFDGGVHSVEKKDGKRVRGPVVKSLFIKLKNAAQSISDFDRTKLQKEKQEGREKIIEERKQKISHYLELCQKACFLIDKIENQGMGIGKNELFKFIFGAILNGSPKCGTTKFMEKIAHIKNLQYFIYKKKFQSLQEQIKKLSPFIKQLNQLIEQKSKLPKTLPNRAKIKQLTDQIKEKEQAFKDKFKNEIEDEADKLSKDAETDLITHKTDIESVTKTVINPMKEDAAAMNAKDKAEKEVKEKAAKEAKEDKAKQTIAKAAAAKKAKAEAKQELERRKAEVATKKKEEKSAAVVGVTEPAAKKKEEEAAAAVGVAAPAAAVVGVTEPVAKKKEEVVQVGDKSGAANASPPFLFGKPPATATSAAHPASTPTSTGSSKGVMGSAEDKPLPVPASQSVSPSQESSSNNLPKWFDYFKQWANKQSHLKIDEDSMKILKDIIKADKKLKGQKLHDFISAKLKANPADAEKLQELMNKLKQTEQTGGGFFSGIGKLFKAAETVAVDTGEAAATAVKDTAEVAEEGEHIASKTAKVGTEVVEEGAHVAEEGAHIASAAAREGAEVAEEGAHVAEEGAKVAEKGAKVAKKAASRAEKMRGVIKKIGQKAFDGVKVMGNATLNVGTTVASTIGDGASGLASGLVNNVSNLGSNVGSSVGSSVVSSVGSYVGNNNSPKQTDIYACVEGGESAEECQRLADQNHANFNSNRDQITRHLNNIQEQTNKKKLQTHITNLDTKFTNDEKISKNDRKKSKKLLKKIKKKYESLEFHNNELDKEIKYYENIEQKCIKLKDSQACNIEDVKKKIQDLKDTQDKIKQFIAKDKTNIEQLETHMNSFNKLSIALSDVDKGEKIYEMLCKESGEGLSDEDKEFMKSWKKKYGNSQSQNGGDKDLVKQLENPATGEEVEKEAKEEAEADKNHPHSSELPEELEEKIKDEVHKEVKLIMEKKAETPVSADSPVSAETLESSVSAETPNLPDSPVSADSPHSRDSQKSAEEYEGTSSNIRETMGTAAETGAALAKKGLGKAASFGLYGLNLASRGITKGATMSFEKLKVARDKRKARKAEAAAKKADKEADIVQNKLHQEVKKKNTPTKSWREHANVAKHTARASWRDLQTRATNAAKTARKRAAARLSNTHKHNTPHTTHHTSHTTHTHKTIQGGKRSLKQIKKKSNHYSLNKKMKK